MLSVEELNQVTIFKEVEYFCGVCFVQSYLCIAMIQGFCFRSPLLVKSSPPFQEERHLAFHRIKLRNMQLLAK